MTGDMGDVFNAMREEKQKRRAANRERGARLLRDAGIAFEVRNGGAHLIVGRYDFWPGTDLWRPRGQRDGECRGVERLIAKVKCECHQQGGNHE